MIIQGGKMFKVDKSNVEDIIALTPLQMGIMFHYLNEPEGDLYFEQLSIRINSEINFNLFEKAWINVIKNNQMLRTIFLWENVREPIQIILKKHIPKIKYFDFSHEKSKADIVNVIRKEDKMAKFNLNYVPFRITLCKLSQNDYEMIISNHHIIYDGWSTGIILKEFFSFYDDLSNNREIKHNKKLHFKDFVRYLSQRNTDIEKEYWSKYLDSLSDITELPFINKKNRAKKSIHKHTENISSALVNTFVTENNITLATLIYCAYGLLLQIYNNSNDVVFGSVVSGRNSEMPGMELCVGQFINTIPFRLKSSEDKKIINVLLDVKKQLIERKDCEHTFITKINEYIENKIKKDLFDSIVVIENYPLDKNVLNNNFNLKVSSYSMDEVTNYNLSICVKNFNKNIEIEFTYSKDVYGSKEINRLAAHFINLINFIINNPNKLISDIQVLSNNEKEQLLCKINSNSYMNCTIQDVFENQVFANSNKIALIDTNLKLSFLELNNKVNKIARRLRQMGVGKDSIVGLMVERSVYSIIGILAIIKAGGAYSVIDIDYPVKRKKYIIDDCRINIILTQKSLYEDLNFGTQILFLDQEEKSDEIVENLFNINAPDDLAYVIYTSGSTGKPKGVMVEHHSIINLAISQIKYFKIDKSERILLFSPLYFDASVEQIFISLFSGATLVIPSNEIILDNCSFISFLKSNSITHLHAVPSYLNHINPDENYKLKRIISGGDICTKILAQKWYKKCEFYNEYGPTETTVTSIEYLVNEIDEELQHILIGTPIQNTNVYIFDNKMRISPVGAIGELYIGGEGVARGYLNQSQLTKEKFICNPYDLSERIYKTGDLVRRLDNENIQFIVRNDNQVKIRGYRIETGEIEAILLKLPEIKEAVVIVRTDQYENKSLWAYITTQVSITYEYLHSKMSLELPDYMIPAYFVILDELPLTGTGKIDVNKLKDASFNIAPLKCKDSIFLGPNSIVEEKIAKACCEVLGVETVSMKDNFFHLGGDSIKAIQVVSRLKTFGYSINVSNLLENPILIDLIPYVKPVCNASINYKVEGNVNFTPIQKWFMESNIKEKNHWNQAVMLYREDGFDIQAVNTVFKKIFEHHDTLRLLMHLDNSCLIYGNNLEIKTEFYDLIHIKDPKDEITRISNILQRSIDIYNGPMMKLALFRTTNGDHLLIIIHHLIVDGVSWRILFNDFSEGYKKLISGDELVYLNKSDSFKKWSETIYEYSNSKKLLNEKYFWEEICTNKSESYLFKSEKILEVNSNCSACIIELNEEDTKFLLENVNEIYNTEIDDILLSALSYSIATLWDKNQTLVNLERHGRENISSEIEVNRTVGWFTSQFPIILPVDRTNLRKHIVNTKETLRKIPHKGIGYGILRYISSVSENDLKYLSINPDINFNYMGQFDEDIKNTIFSISPYDVGECFGVDFDSLYIININAIVRNSILSFAFKYDFNRISQTEVEKFSKCYESSLLEIIKHCKNNEEKFTTPSDYDAKNLSCEELEYIQSLYK